MTEQYGHNPEENPDLTEAGNMGREGTADNHSRNGRRERSRHGGRNILVGAVVGAVAVGGGAYFLKVRPAQEAAHKQQVLANQKVDFDKTLRLAGYNTLVTEFTDFSHNGANETAKVTTQTETRPGCSVTYNVTRTANSFRFTLPPLVDANGTEFPSFVGTSAAEVTAETDQLCTLKAEAEAANPNRSPSASPTH